LRIHAERYHPAVTDEPGHGHQHGDAHAHQHGAAHAHQHGDAHAHQHGAALARSGTRHRARLLVAFVLGAVVLVVEAVTALLTNSLALLSDAGHMLTDVIGLGMALAAIQLADRHARARRTTPSPHTFGLYRLEILAALVNAVLLFGVAVFVLVEAVDRLRSESEVEGWPMLIVASIGLVANLVSFALLRQGAKESLNVQGAYLEVLSDAVGSVGVILAAVALQLFGWSWIDPVVGAAIGLWILPRTWRLGRQAVHILMQSAPARVNLARLHDELEAIPGVVGVHDLHVWTLTSDMDAASAHLVTADGVDAHGVLDDARALLADRYLIAHGTFQVEPSSHTGCTEVDW